MNLTFLSKTDKELDIIRSAKNCEGKWARKEITRRIMVGYSDGTMFSTAKATVEVEPQVGTSKVVMPTPRKVEKKMAGRGK